jgi:hypothetical protein
MYLVYKITNKLNQKTYIGVHKTDNLDDGYMGSGLAIKAAIRKHGRENFKKEVLFITEDKSSAYGLERKLTVDFASRDNYNMKLGGIGGFTKEDARKGLIAKSVKGGKAAVEQKKGYHSFTKEQLSENGKKGGLKNKGKPKSEAHKQAVRDAWARKKLCAGSSTVEPTAL